MGKDYERRGVKNPRTLFMGPHEKNMKKKLLVLLIVLAVLLGLYFIDSYFNFNYLSRPGLNKGYENLIPSTTDTFKGPANMPSALFWKVRRVHPH